MKYSSVLIYFVLYYASIYHYSIAIAQNDEVVKQVIQNLDGVCLNYTRPHEWWSYRWCHELFVEQYHFSEDLDQIDSYNKLGTFSNSDSDLRRHVFITKKKECFIEQTGDVLKRMAAVNFYCCIDKNNNKKAPSQFNIPDLYLVSVSEPSPCIYDLAICYKALCDIDNPELNSKKNKVSLDLPKEDKVKRRESAKTKTMPMPQAVRQQISSVKKTIEKDTHASVSATRNKNKPDVLGMAASTNTLFPSFTSEQQSQALERVREMFYHGYNSYMSNAFPEGELRPLSCKGGAFELVKLPLVTLIDTLDTLVVMGDHAEFRRAVSIVCDQLKGFNFDVNVSLFETTIRVLGGLLAAHLLAVDSSLNIYTDISEPYSGCLLSLAHDLGDRLFPAFATATGIPFGTVNLRFGVPEGESEVASTAGAGSLLVEFQTLSSLSGDVKYGRVAYRAMRALYRRRSALGLLGKHIHIQTGRWHETLSGIGSNSDSFYEYLHKAELLFRRPALRVMFSDVYRSVKRHVQAGPWFADVDMFSGQIRRPRLESLSAFWPGLEASLGMVDSSANLLNAMYLVSNDQGFLPEEFDYVKWQLGKGPHSLYPLRPELLESTYQHYRATGDRSWLAAAMGQLDSLEKHTRVPCGHAAVQDIATLQLADEMPSFFLSETCKYLYLIFDETNFVHSRPYVFTTEAHLLDASQLREIERQRESVADPLEDVDEEFEDYIWGFEHDDMLIEVVEAEEEDAERMQFKGRPKVVMLPHKCPMKYWWEGGSSSYRPPSTLDVVNQNIEVNEVINNEGGSSSGSGSGTHSNGNTHQRKDVLEGFGKCSPTDNPELNVVAGEEENQSKSKSVQVVIPGLGKYTVKVFVDGFVIQSLRHGDTMEISAVGQPLALVRYSRKPTALQEALAVSPESEPSTSTSTSSDASGKKESAPRSPAKSVMGGAKNVLICSVHIVGPGGEDMDAMDESALKAFIGEDGTAITPDALQSRFCSVAAFGPTATPAFLNTNSMSIEFEAELAVAADGVGCAIPTARKSTSKKGGSWWPSWAMSSGSAGGNNSDEKEKLHEKVYEGKIALLKRGGCLFEEKTLLAEAAGAAGVIIANTDDFVFIMSGKKMTSKDGLPPAAPVPSSNSTSFDPQSAMTTVPTVMLSATDISSLVDALLKVNKAISPSSPSSSSTSSVLDPIASTATATAASSSSSSSSRPNDFSKDAAMSSLLPKIRIRITSRAYAMDGEDMGQTLYPKIRVKENLIFVLGEGEWGAILQSQVNAKKESEWQLFIHHKHAIEAMTSKPYAMTAFNKAGQPITLAPPHVTPVGAYWFSIAKQCPPNYGLPSLAS